MLCFLSCLPLFSVSVLGAWHYVYHQLMMLKFDLWMLLELDTQAWKRVVQVPRMVSNMGRRSWRRSGMRMRIWWSLSQVSWLQKATVSWSDGKCIQRNGLIVYITAFLVLTWKWWYYLNLMKLLLDLSLEIDIIAGENNNTYFWWAIHMCQFSFLVLTFSQYFFVLLK